MGSTKPPFAESRGSWLVVANILIALAL